MSNALSVVQNDSVIIRLIQAGTALTEAKTIQQTKKIVDIAAAAEIWAKRQQLGDEAESIALSIKLDALRQLGGMIQNTPLNAGNILRGTKMVPRGNQGLTLKELGLDKKTSSIAQKLAALPEKAFKQVREGHETISKALAAVKTIKPTPKPAPKPAIVDDFGDSAAKELEHADQEIRKLQALVESLQSSDLGKEVAAWHLKFDKLDGRLQQCMTTKNEAERQARYSTGLLEKIRKTLRVEKNSLILEAIADLRR